MADLKTYNNIVDLFEQLGLASDEASIDNFFERYAPLPNDVALWDAPWWNAGQAQFLREALNDDATWEIAVDELNTRLRQDPKT